MFGIKSHFTDGGNKAQKSRVGHSILQMKQEDPEKKFM